MQSVRLSSIVTREILHPADAQGVANVYYRNGARKPLGFSQGRNGLPLDTTRTHVLLYQAGETAKLAGETRSPHKPQDSCSMQLALLVTGRVPPECASASLGRWMGRLRRPWGFGLDL